MIGYIYILLVLITFSPVGRGPGDVRVFIDVNHISSTELDDFARLGFILHMKFTYVLFASTKNSCFQIVILTFNDVHDSCVSIMTDDGFTDQNFSEPCHQIVRFIDRAVLIEPVDLHVLVVFMSDGALKAGLGSFDVLG